MHDWTATYEAFWQERIDQLRQRLGRAMNLDVRIEELLPHPVESVWGALTDAASISDWLMATNDFRPQVGARFRMKTGHLSADGWVEAEVLELDPPRRMVWAWSIAAAPSRRASRSSSRPTAAAPG